VDGTLVLRLQRLPDEAGLADLSDEFADITRGAPLRPTAPSDAEVAEEDWTELPRLALDFDQRSFGRLRQLIDALNGY
jgi:hypothetical protein